MYSLRFLNALAHSSVHVMYFLFPLSALKKGAHMSVALEMNLVKAATLPVRLWMSFEVIGYFMSRIALIFSGLASMPRWLIMKPKNLPEPTPKAHLLGFNLIRYLFRMVKVSDRSVMCWSACLLLTSISST
ncbi:hypothetical protein EV1_035261 [Malus domestica]